LRIHAQTVHVTLFCKRKLMASYKPKLAIIAGGGDAPRRVIDACRAQGRDFFVVCLEGQAEADLGNGLPHAWLPLGAGGKLRDLVREQQIGEIVMIGHVRRPSLRELKPDWLTLKIVTRIGMNMLGDDGLLRAIGSAIEQECGVKMIGAHDILGGILAREGALGAISPDGDAQADIERGVAVAGALGAADVGQSVVVQQGLVLGVEAIEGTDALLARCAGLRRDGRGGVLIKLAKPQQDERYDLPTIGPDTVEAAAKAGLRGIAVEAGRAILIDRERVRQMADEMGLFIVGLVNPGG
jgi:DUF1009 family protein